MTQLRTLWTGMRTRDVEDAGTDNNVALTIDAVQLTFGDTLQDDLEPGVGNLYAESVTSLNISPESLNNSSVRMTVLGDDAWRPQDIFVWGEQLADGAVVPVAMETDIQAQLSTDPNEGNAGLPLPLIGTGNALTLVNRVLLIAHTADADDSGTDTKINVSIKRADDVTVFDFTMGELKQSQVMFSVVPVDVPFTKGGAKDNPVRIKAEGDDAWLPARFFLFGLDTAEGRPRQIVPLVHIPLWNQGWLSTNTNDAAGTAKISVSLPFLP